MRNASVLTLALLTGIACQERPAATVTIEQPADGATIPGDSVDVMLSATGVEIVPADGEPTPGRAHHHLFLDADLTSAGEPIPDETEMQGLKHLGTGASSWTFKNVAPGEHRLIAVLARGDHVPLDPWATDTVTFTVVPEPMPADTMMADTAR